MRRMKAKQREEIISTQLRALNEELGRNNLEKVQSIID